MNEVIQSTQALSSPEFHSYENLAYSSLPNETVIYSTEKGIEYKKPSIQGLFHGNSVASDERAAITNQKSKTDFYDAVRKKFGGITNYASPLVEDEEETPLTLGEIRQTIEETRLNIYLEQQKNNPLLKDNSYLAELTGRMIIAKENAERAAAHLDELGYPKEHLEEVFRTTTKLLADAGMTVAILGVASYVAAATLAACSSAVAATTLVSGASRIYQTLHEGHSEEAIGHLLVTEAALAIGTQASMLVSPGLAAGHAVIQGIPSAIAMLGFTTEKGKELGEAMARFLPSISSSFQSARQAASGFTEVQKAIVQAVVTRATANALLEQVKQETENAKKVATSSEISNVQNSDEETKTLLQQISELAEKNVSSLKEFLNSSKQILEEPKLLIEEAVNGATQIHLLIQFIQKATIVDQKKLAEFLTIVKTSSGILEKLPSSFKSNQIISQCKLRLQNIEKIGQQLRKPSSEEIEKEYIKFLNAIASGIHKGKAEMEKLKKESTLMPPSGEEQRRLTNKKASPYTRLRQLPI